MRWSRGVNKEGNILKDKRRERGIVFLETCTILCCHKKKDNTEYDYEYTFFLPPTTCISVYIFVKWNRHMLE